MAVVPLVLVIHFGLLCVGLGVLFGELLTARQQKRFRRQLDAVLLAPSEKEYAD